MRLADATRRNGSRMLMHVLLTIAAIIAALYLIAVVSLYIFQRRLIYYPDPIHYTPAEAELPGVREVTIGTPDGERLVAWWAKASAGQPTILYFHGNAGGLNARAERIKRFAGAGFGVFMPAYRGYSGSSGEPSERALVADALLVYDDLRTAGVAADDIVAYGESLGSGVAVQLAAVRHVGALVLDAPYTSLPDIGKRLYPYAPVGTFMIDRFDSKTHIAKVKAPILILHGTNDTTVPIGLGRALFEIAPEPKEFAAIESAGHSNIYLFGAFARLEDFLSRHRSRPDLHRQLRRRL